MKRDVIWKTLDTVTWYSDMLKEGTIRFERLKGGRTALPFKEQFT